MKKLKRVLAWFAVTVPLTIFAIQFFRTYEHHGELPLIRQQPPTGQGNYIPYASLPKFSLEIKSALASSDARPQLIEKYLKYYNSPMLPYARYIVDVSDVYQMDPYLVVAIAQQESNLGKLMPPDCHNAWGWGIHSAGTLCFDNWEEGINTFISGLAKNYLSYGLKTPQEIMTKYNSTSPGGAWAKGVSYFLAQLHSGQW